jgi:hypothetical protein
MYQPQLRKQVVVVFIYRHRKDDAALEGPIRARLRTPPADTRACLTHLDDQRYNESDIATMGGQRIK